MGMDKSFIKVKLKKVKVSFKNTLELSKMITHKKILKALTLIYLIKNKKIAVNIRKHNSGIGRTMKTFSKLSVTAQGRFPVKSCDIILKLLKKIIALLKKCRKSLKYYYIDSIIINKTSMTSRKIHRAFGRINHIKSVYCSLEIIVKKMFLN